MKTFDCTLTKIDKYNYFTTYCYKYLFNFIPIPEQNCSVMHLWVNFGMLVFYFSIYLKILKKITLTFSAFHFPDLAGHTRPVCKSNASF